MLDAANGIGERQRERGEIDRFVVEDEHFSGLWVLLVGEKLELTDPKLTKIVQV